MSRRDLECKVYVGDLPRDASEKDIEKAFAYYGNLRSVWVARNPPGFAFVEFDDPRDAEDAVRDMDGRHVCGVRARVEFSNGKVRPKPWLSSRGGSRRYDPDDRCYSCGERGHYAYDCRGRRGRSRSRSYDRRRSYSPDRRRRSYSPRRSRSRDRRRSRSRSRSRSYRSRSRSRD